MANMQKSMTESMFLMLREQIIDMVGSFLEGVTTEKEEREEETENREKRNEEEKKAVS